MTKRSRHYCTTCHVKQPFAVDKHGFLAILFTVGLAAVVNAFKTPRCEVCGAKYRGPLVTAIARLR